MTLHDSQPSRYTTGGMSHTPAEVMMEVTVRVFTVEHMWASVTMMIPSPVAYTWRPPKLDTTASRNASSSASRPDAWRTSRLFTHQWKIRTPGNFRDRLPTTQSWRTSIEAANRLPSEGWGIAIRIVGATVERRDKRPPAAQRPMEVPYRLRNIDA